jgi:hypothetical protein
MYGSKKCNRWVVYQFYECGWAEILRFTQDPIAACRHNDLNAPDAITTYQIKNLNDCEILFNYCRLCLN